MCVVTAGLLERENFRSFWFLVMVVEVSLWWGLQVALRCLFHFVVFGASVLTYCCSKKGFSGLVTAVVVVGCGLFGVEWICIGPADIGLHCSTPTPP